MNPFYEKLLSKVAFFVIPFALFVPLSSQAQEDERYTTPSQSLHFAFNYGNFGQENFPTLSSDIGAAFTVYHSYWLFKPRSHRFQLGIDVAWFDVNYYNYKVNMHTFEGSDVKYTMHQGDAGIQAGVGVNFCITRDLRLHWRVCYNPAFSGVYQNESFQGAFANYCVTGLSLTWKCIGLGIDARFGAVKYKELDFFDFMEDDDDAFADDIKPKRIGTNLMSLRTSLVFSF